MSNRPFDAAFARRLGAARGDLIRSTDNGYEVEQLGIRAIDFADAPPWPVLEAAPDEALIESFLVAEDGSLTPLSDAPELDAWRKRAEAFADRVVAALADHEIAIEFPCFLTCSITPIHLVEGNPHLDDDQCAGDTGIGLVAITGQHVGPRAATGSMPLLARPAVGPLPLDDEHVEAFRSSDMPRTSEHEIAVLGQFGQLHAGPASTDLAGADHRQLMVLRAATRVADG